MLFRIQNRNFFFLIQRLSAGSLRQLICNLLHICRWQWSKYCTDLIVWLNIMKRINIIFNLSGYISAIHADRFKPITRIRFNSKLSQASLRSLKLAFRSDVSVFCLMHCGFEYFSIHQIQHCCTRFRGIIIISVRIFIRHKGPSVLFFSNLKDLVFVPAYSTLGISFWESNLRHTFRDICHSFWIYRIHFRFSLSQMHRKIMINCIEQSCFRAIYKTRLNTNTARNRESWFPDICHIISILIKAF